MANNCSNIKDPKARQACLKAQKGGGTKKGLGKKPETPQSGFNPFSQIRKRLSEL